jgi:hypothetical protein
MQAQVPVIEWQAGRERLGQRQFDVDRLRPRIQFADIQAEELDEEERLA